MYGFDHETTAHSLQDTFNDILMPHLISFGVSSISWNPKTGNFTLYPVILIYVVVQTAWLAAILKNVSSPETGHISVAYWLPIIIKMFPMNSSICVPRFMLLS